MPLKKNLLLKHGVNVLTGKEDQTVKSYGHNKLEVFGEGAEKDIKFWTAVIRQTLLANFLSKDIDNYGLLKITPEGKEYLNNPTSFMITQDHDYDDTESEDDDEPSGSGGGSAADAELFAMLKDLCKKVAKQKNVPPFVVFQETSLEEMAIQYPITMDELKNISGVGPGKAQKFGKPFIELISKYVEENEIDRPMDLVVKSVVNKSGLKVYIIQNIDRKLSLDDIADAKGITLTELINEIESIVSSGTKIDINYYLNEVIDEERQDEVYDYFRTAETDSIEDAMRELREEEYSEDEIRMMRIKFMSEMAN